MAFESRHCPVHQLTRGPRAHFFGYYDKPPWDVTGRHLVCLEAEETGRMPLPGEQATIALVEAETAALHPLASTRAWNWQQGCMLQWVPGAADRLIIYNDLEDGRHVAVILDIHSGRRRLLPRPVYAVSPDGRWGLSLNLARLAHARPIVGYAGIADPFHDQLHPEEDGVWWMDLDTGEHRLALPLDAVARLAPVASTQGVHHRFEHATIAPDGSRFFVLHRWPRPGKGRPFFDRLLTCDPNGSNLHLLAGDDLVSHFDWRDGQHILAWARVAGRGDHFYLFRDRSEHVEIIGGDVLTRDGHCSYSPDRRWILADAYPDADWQLPVLLYEVESGRCVEIGRFQTRPTLYQTPGIRCDLHPRWSRDGRQVCIDTPHEGPRQMYAIDVSPIVEP